MRPYRQRLRRRGASSVDVTAFLSLMVILVPFLLISAVFSRMTIIELQGVSDDAHRTESRDPLQLQIVVRERILEVRHFDAGEAVRFPRNATGSELVALSELLAELNRRHPLSSEATILLEPQIPYDDLVQVMDRVRVGTGDRDKPPLFPDIALAETPVALDRGQDSP